MADMNATFGPSSRRGVHGAPDARQGRGGMGRLLPAYAIGAVLFLQFLHLMVMYAGIPAFVMSFAIMATLAVFVLLIPGWFLLRDRIGRRDAM